MVGPTMAHHPTVRRHTRKGRSPWFTLQTGGKVHHLGTDRAKAHRRAADLLGGDSGADPATAQGLIVAWITATGAAPCHVSRWGQFCGDMPLADLTATSLQAYADHLRDARHARTDKTLSNQTIRHYVAYARACWQWGIDQGWLTVAPGKVKTAAPMIVPRDHKPVDLQARFDKLNPRARVLAESIVATGCRPGEARLLRWSQVDLDRGVCVLEQHKTQRTGKPRTIFLTENAAKILSGQPKVNQYVFLSIHKKPYTKDGYHTVLSRAGINSAYSLRHTFAQWFLDHGGPGGAPGDKSELSAWLGHSSSRMVDVYAQIRDIRLRQVAKRLTGPMAG